MTKILAFSDKQKRVIQKPFLKELEVYEGTPRSGKTTAAHFRFARYLLETDDYNHLVAGYNQEQAFRLFIDGDGTGLMHIFAGNCQLKHDDHGDHLLIHTPKGDRRVYFKGGGKANSVGAITGLSFGGVVLCEINLIHMSFLQEVFRRTMAAQMPFHLADLNPPSPMHPVIEKIFNVRDMDWTHWTMDDNPVLTPERKAHLIKILSNSQYLTDRDVLGKRVLPQGVIYGNLNLESHTKYALQGDVLESFFSIDAGQSDATTASYNIVTFWKGKPRLYRVANYFHSGGDTGQTKAMSTYAKEILDFMRWCKQTYGYHYSEVFVDPAAKSLREEFHKIGIMTRGADNNNADKIGGKNQRIEVGIERGKNIIANDQFFLLDTQKYDHYNFIQEIGLYVRDDNGTPVDKNNHTMDDFRYSVNYFYKRYVKG